MTTIWKDGVFGLGSGTLEALMNALDQFDFAIMVLSPDDLLESRGTSYSFPRDNVIFELGLFMGRLGLGRTFIVSEQDADLKLPSDLAGITRATYRRRDNLAAALSPACTLIIRAIRSLGIFESRQNTQQSRSTVDTGKFLMLNLPDTSTSYYDLPASPYGVIWASSIPFRILPYVQDNVLKGHTTVTVGPKHDGSPNRNRIECDVQNVKSIYVLWTAANGWKSYQNVQFENRRIGNLELTFADGPPMSLPAILGQNIREWIYHNPSPQGQGVVNTLSDRSVSQVWHSLGDLHTLDMIKIDIKDPPRHLQAIELVGAFEFPTTIPGEYLPHFRVSALTCGLAEVYNASIVS